MEKDFKFNLANLKIDQLGYVYRNIEEQAKVMETTYNVPKFAFMEEANLLVNSRGKDRKISLRFGFSRILNAQIELIEWRAGDCIY